MDKDERTKLGILLNHWIEHNKEHGQDFSEWAIKAKALGEAEAGEDILQAAQEMDKASEILSQARQRLDRREG